VVGMKPARTRMVTLMAGSILLLCCARPTVAVQGTVTPVQKVVQMLEDMVKNAEAGKHEEQVQFAAFSQFCSDVTLEKDSTIKETAQQLDISRSAVQSHDTEAARLDTQIQGHIDQVTSLKAEQEAAQAARSQEQEAYFLMRQNYTESLEALSSAISMLKAQNYERAGKGPAALLEEKLDAKYMQVLRALSAEEPDLDFVPDVPTTAYTPKSGNIVSMLEKLEEEFRDRSHTLDKEEADRRHGFDMVVQDRTDSIKAEEDAQAENQKNMAKYRQLSAEAVADLKDLAALLDDDTKYLDHLKTTCDEKAKEYDSRQALRKEEIAALGQGIEIISSSEVSGAAKKHLSAAALVAGATHGNRTSLVQLRASRGKPGLGLTSFKAATRQMRVAAFLRDASERLHSTALSALSSKAEADPFAKVKQLIEELVQRLMQEATNEVSHKGWCDTELSTNEHTRKTKTAEVEMLRAEIDSLEAGIAQLDKDLAELATSINTTEADVAEATGLREKERAENNVTVVEAQQAQVAVAEAVKILTEFYGKAAKATALVQGQQKKKLAQEPPKLFEDGPYKGQQAESGGVLGMFEVIHSDFLRLESDTKTAEDEAQALYDKFMEDSLIAKAQMDVSVKDKTKEHGEKSFSLDEKRTALESTEQMLSSAQDEFEKLKPTCLDVGQTYEEHAQNRKDEVEALKEALRILDEV